LRSLIRILLKAEVVLNYLVRGELRSIQVKNTSIHEVGGTSIDWQKFLPENAVIVEVGAYNGHDSAYFAATFPKGKVFCFEPDLELFAQVFEKSKIWSNISCFPFAVAKKTEVCTFFPSYGDSRASGSIRLPTNHLEFFPDIIFPENKRNRTLSVSLDEFFSDEIGTVDLLWVDAQGSELEIFQGASKFLMSVSYIICEVSLIPLYDGGASMSEIVSFLYSIGFTLLASDVDQSSNEYGQMGNAFFGRVNKSDSRQTTSVALEVKNKEM
jgi:FkbM family methyltransferase